MKKSYFLLFLLFLPLFGEQPPSLPKKTLLPKECKTIPPMIIFLPPPMEKELIPCKNEVFKPTLKMVRKKFKSAKKVEVAKGFERLYHIILEHNISIYCNKELSSCIQGTKLP